MLTFIEIGAAVYPWKRYRSTDKVTFEFIMLNLGNIEVEIRNCTSLCQPWIVYNEQNMLCTSYGLQTFENANLKKKKLAEFLSDTTDDGMSDSNRL